MKKTISWGAIIGCAAVIFYLSNQPAAVSKELSGQVKSIIEGVIQLMKGTSDEPVVISHNTLRKTAHYLIYLVLGFLLMIVLMKEGKNLNRFFIVVLMSALFACTDELHQQFILGRSGELRDVLIDTLGAATGGLVLLGIVNITRSIKEKSSL
ncbi:VanZ family protein [Chryseomicrobium palamuruense]|uniref:VanZ family protein n=1 Tax=Chryseomicrobium palamuruense TaxID=682973 RepID=A0ABV8USQ3_9BACL